MFNFEEFGSEEEAGVSDISIKKITPQQKQTGAGFDFEAFGDDSEVQVTPEEKKPGLLKTVGGALIESEKEFGEGIAQAIAAPFYQKQIEENNARFMKAGKNMMELAQKTADPVKRETYMNTAQDYFDKAGSGIQDVMGEIKTSKQVLGSAGGVLLDVLSAGTYGQAAKAAKTGQLLKPIAKTAPTVATKFGAKGVKEAAKKTAAGAALGYGYDVTTGLQQGEEGLEILKPGYGTLFGAAIPAGAFTAKAATKGVKKGLAGIAKHTADIPDELVADYLQNTKKVESLIKKKATPEQALRTAQGAVRDLRTKMTQEWGEATAAISEKYKNVTSLADSRLKQLENIADKFGDDILNKVDAEGNITQINPVAMTVDDSLALLKNVNNLYGQRIVRESAEGIPVRSFKDFFKGEVIESFGGKKGEVADLYSNYSAKKGILDAANDIVKAYDTGKPIRQATALGRIKSIFRENKGAYIKAIKDLEQEMGVDITSYITAAELSKGLTPTKVVTAGGAGIFSKKGIIDKVFEAILFPITTPKYARYLLRGAKEAGETVIDKASKTKKPSLINQAFPQPGKESPAEVTKTIIGKAKKIKPGLTIENVVEKIDSDDISLMTEFIDNVRLKKGENVKLEVDVRKMAEAMGINPDQSNAKIVNKFEQILQSKRDLIKKGSPAVGQTVKKEMSKARAEGKSFDEFVRKSKKVYHVTNKKNLKSIEKDGILPQETQSGDYGAFAFKELDDAEDFMMDVFGDDDSIKIIEMPVFDSDYKKLKADPWRDRPSAILSEEPIKSKSQLKQLWDKETKKKTKTLISK